MSPPITTYLDRRPTPDEARALSQVGPGGALDELIEVAGELRDQGHGNLVSYSRKVFLPLTHLCRDICHYCVFAQPPEERRGGLHAARHRPGPGAPRRRCRLQGSAVHPRRQAGAAVQGRPRRPGRTRPRHDPLLPARGRRTGTDRDRTPAPPEPGPDDRRGHRAPTPRVAVHGHHAGERLDAPAREGPGALRLPRQGAGATAGDAPAGRRGAGALHLRHPDRHRRDPRGTDRRPARDARPARRVRAYPGSHHPELPRQARDPDGGRARADARGPAVDDRRGPPRARTRDAHPGAAQPEPGRPAATRRGRHRRLGRRIAGHPGLRQSGGALAAPRTPGRRDRLRRQDPGRAADRLPGVGYLWRTLARRRPRPESRHPPHGRCPCCSVAAD